MTWLRRPRLYCPATHEVESRAYGYRHQAGCMRLPGPLGAAQGYGEVVAVREGQDGPGKATQAPQDRP